MSEKRNKLTGMARFYSLKNLLSLNLCSFTDKQRSDKKQQDAQIDVGC